MELSAKNARPEFVVFEGIISAGKSTIIPLVAEALRAAGKKVAVVLEPVEEWKEILPLFYKDPQRHAMSFQLTAYASRNRAVREALKNFPGGSPPDIVLLERCSESDRMFMDMFRGVVEGVEMDIYSTVCGEIDESRVFDPQDASVVFLDPDVDVCMQRVKARGRAAEAELGSSYQFRLRRAHCARLLRTDAEEFPRLANRPLSKTLLHLRSNYANCDFRGSANNKSVRTITEWILALP
jgi:deoxyadenosine/deoxycytidine kinase